MSRRNFGHPILAILNDLLILNVLIVGLKLLASMFLYYLLSDQESISYFSDLENVRTHYGRFGVIDTTEALLSVIAFISIIIFHTWLKYLTAFTTPGESLSGIVVVDGRKFWETRERSTSSFRLFFSSLSLNFIYLCLWQSRNSYDDFWIIVEKLMLCSVAVVILVFMKESHVRLTSIVIIESALFVSMFWHFGSFHYYVDPNSVLLALFFASTLVLAVVTWGQINGDRYDLEPSLVEMVRYSAWKFLVPAVLLTLLLAASFFVFLTH